MSTVNSSIIRLEPQSRAPPDDRHFVRPRSVHSNLHSHLTVYPINTCIPVSPSPISISFTSLFPSSD
ncbi:hypothetical protein JTE90_002010 [Oedothorax gibbosus]|uniref:Uncharacterized protein n=1 Tax=Oedothorax gibbosus TaxID=931172 RepID=A0AAV6TGF5_9ARAC|nr:hypothetical protein JTE90_002010 [Oedothorax gibbosus]